MGVGQKCERKGVRGERIVGQRPSWGGKVSAGCRLTIQNNITTKYRTCKDKVGANVKVIGGAGVRGKVEKSEDLESSPG